jgi:uncharacterized membrane protein
VIPLVFTLKVLHIAVSAVWIGGGLTAPRDIRRTLVLGQPHTGELMLRLRAISRLMNGSALLTVLTGLALVFAVGGFTRIPHRIHVGILLTVLAFVAGRWLIRPVLGQIAAAIKGPEPVSEETARRIVGKFWLVNGVEHGLRLGVLVVMVYPFTF